MPLALTCSCGVRLEVDDKFAGQTITCPDCHRLIQAPKSPRQSRRTSGLALASVILALVGAFTVVGTIAAVAVGAVALVQLAKRPEQLAGRGFALAGIFLGATMTAGTIFALSTFELFGWTALLTDANWLGKLEFGGPLEVVCQTEGFALTRPSASWGVYKPPVRPFTGDFNQSAPDDLLLVLPREDAVILCFPLQVGRETPLEACKDKFLKDFRTMQKLGLFSKSVGGMRGSTSVTVQDTKRPAKKDGLETVEILVDKSAAGEDKSFLVRLVKADADETMYVVIGGVRRGHFHRLEGQFRDAVASFRLLARNNRRGW